MFKGLLFFVKEGLKYDKCYILWRVLYQLTNAPLPVIASVFPKWIIDELMGKQRINHLVIYVAVMAGYTLLATILSAYFYSDGFTRRCRAAAEFDSSLHRRLYECDYENLESPRFLEMQQKAQKFLSCNWHGFGYLLDCAMNICGELITLAGLAIIISTMNVWIVLLFIFMALTSAMIEGNTKKKVLKMEEAMIDDQRRWQYFSELFEKVEYGKEFRVNQMGEALLSKERHFFTRANNALKKQNDEFIKSGTGTAIFTFLQQGIAYAYLIYNVISGELSIGSFSMYISAITVFASAFRKVMTSLADIRAFDMYYENLEEYLAVPNTLRGGRLKPQSGKEHVIEFKDVSFRYTGSQVDVLKHINLTITPGEKMLIVGENGAGKTTFIKLLLRLYDPTEGEILLDDINIKEYDYDAYLALFSTVFQDYKLFAFSLKENVSMLQREENGKIEQILKTVGLENRLQTLENGMDTAIYKIFDENGFEPSGGEGQKIAIARALYKDAPVVILDEPTAALDPRAEFEIYQQFDHMVEDKTAIYISHRLSSAKFCDQICVFEKGKIIEYGPHESLIQRNGKYTQLYQMQANFYN